MRAVTAGDINGKKVLLRYDIDVALEPRVGSASRRTEFVVKEDFKLRAGLPTLKLCLDNASKVIVIGHLGRPEGKVVEELRVAPIVEWFKNHNLRSHIESGKLVVLENLRFDPREEAGDPEYAKELASLGDVYINEAFSSHNPAASTTIVPTLLPHAAGLHFAGEVRVLTSIRDNPQKPFVAIMGGAKVQDKLPVISVLAEKADAVLVGGKLVAEIREQDLNLPKNVLVGILNEDGLDIAPETVSAWGDLISKAAMIVWNGPVGKFEDPKNDATAKVARMVLDCSGEVVFGGGDIVAALSQFGLLKEAEEKTFVSVGGGAMLKFLAEGTLPTIKSLS